MTRAVPNAVMAESAQNHGSSRAQAATSQKVVTGTTTSVIWNAPFRLMEASNP